MASRNEPSRRYHDRVARRYDEIYDDPFWRFHDELTWRAIKPHLPRAATAHCADLGCGTGKWGLRLLRSGYATTFVDHSAAMVAQVRARLEEMPSARAARASLVVADIVDLSALAAEQFELIVAMGDPLSICSDPQAAARQMHRITRPGGIVIATADNKLAALEHYARQGNLEALEEFVQTGRTRWLTADQRERFELTTFTPAELQRLFDRSGFDVLGVAGKTILPLRRHAGLLDQPEAQKRLLRLEASLAADSSAAAAASHLQITARRRP